MEEFQQELLVKKRGNMDLSRTLFCFFLCMNLTSCTYSITMVHTQGQATDVVDETSTPKANVSPSFEIPASVL